MSEPQCASHKPAGADVAAPASGAPAAEQLAKAGNGRQWVKLGVGAAIGSAAIAAALLYANRSSRNDRS